MAWWQWYLWALVSSWLMWELIEWLLSRYTKGYSDGWNHYNQALVLDALESQFDGKTKE